MSRFPVKCVVDTNVPVIANLAKKTKDIDPDLLPCVFECVKVIERIIKEGKLVLDSREEIFSEYIKNLHLSGQPGLGDAFVKWVHNNQWGHKIEMVAITKVGNSYEEFPGHAGLIGFDDSDRKFVAVANAHREKPPIFQATDSKWWKYKDVFKGVGVSIIFICPDYVMKKAESKRG